MRLLKYPQTGWNSWIILTLLKHCQKSQHYFIDVKNTVYYLYGLTLPAIITYLSTSVLMTANVSSTRPSTFCFFRLGSWGPRPRRGGLTGSLGRLLRVSPASTLAPVPWSTRLVCPLDALDEPWWWSSKSLSSRHTQLFPMVPELETTVTRISQNGGREFKVEK